RKDDDMSDEPLPWWKKASRWRFSEPQSRSPPSSRAGCKKTESGSYRRSSRFNNSARNTSAAGSRCFRLLLLRPAAEFERDAQRGGAKRVGELRMLDGARHHHATDADAGDGERSLSAPFGAAAQASLEQIRHGPKYLLEGQLDARITSSDIAGKRDSRTA